MPWKTAQEIAPRSAVYCRTHADVRMRKALTPVYSIRHEETYCRSLQLVRCAGQGI